MRRNILLSLINEELEKQNHPLFEGRGMAFRKEGESFQTKNGQSLTLSQVFLLPPGGGKYETVDETQDTISNVAEENMISIEKEVNAANRAAMLVVLQDDSGEKYGYVRYFATMNTDGKGKWPEKDFAQQTGILRAGKEITTSGLENMLIKPSDLVGDEKERTPAELVKHCMTNAKKFAKKGALPEDVVKHMQQIFSAALKNQTSPILKGGGTYAPAYNKYLGEILAPISVVTGWLSTGDRDSSQEALLGGTSYGEMKIKFSMSANEKLVDSKLVGPNGETVGVSSKAGKGAAATTTTIVDVLKNFKKNDAKGFSAFTKKHQLFYKTIETIANKNWFDGPVELAKQFNMLSSTDLRILERMKAKPNMTLQEFKRTIKMSKNLNELAKQLKGVSPAEIDQAGAGYEPVYHVISGIAKAVVAKINQSGEFDKGVRTALNRSSMIQVNSGIKVVKKEDAQFAKFEIKYPPDFSGKVVADAAKNYSATRIRGKISFKMI